jgi:DNA helicase-2/ATP-dependent DNA helicase PcrA
MEIILGPPGTGKTTHLLGIVEEELAKGIPPDRIAYLSFTKRAAQEAVDRALQQFPYDRKDFAFFRTLHSLCFKQLGLRSGDVLQGRRIKDFGTYAGVNISGRWTDDGLVSSFGLGDRMLFMENLARIRGVPLRKQYDEFGDDGIEWIKVDQFSKDLKHFKVHHRLLDYTDMLDEFLQGGRVPKLDTLLVDEGQDLSPMQWHVVHKINQQSGCKRFVIAGDDDQGIYRWAGADVDVFMNMQGSVRVLDQSWRVPQSVQKVCNSVVNRISRRRAKQWNPRAALGNVERLGGLVEADLDGKDILILSRNAHFLENVVEPELKLRGMIYEFRDRLSIQPEILRVITAWEALRAGQNVDIGEARLIYEYMTNGKGYAAGSTLQGFTDDSQVSLADLRAKGGLLRDAVWHEALDRLPVRQMEYLLAARRRGEKLKQKPRIKLSTIHAAKGGEAEHVVLLTDMAYRTFKEMDTWSDDEARVWYVGTTRAKEKLTIIIPQTKMFFSV